MKKTDWRQTQRLRQQINMKETQNWLKAEEINAHA
jgi:hypothetical protein